MLLKKLAPLAALMMFASQGVMAAPQYGLYPYPYPYPPPPAAVAEPTRPQSNPLENAGNIIGTAWGAIVPANANAQAIKGASTNKAWGDITPASVKIQTIKGARGVAAREGHLFIFRPALATPADQASDDIAPAANTPAIQVAGGAVSREENIEH